MDLIIARAIHVISIVLWIGGVGFVTTVALPTIRRREPPELRLGAFLQFESGFAPQARIFVGVAGLSGLYLTAHLEAWSRFADLRFWWMDAMVGLWMVFALMLFVLEPAILRRRLARLVDSPQGARVFDRMQRLHQILFSLAIITVVGAVMGSHGL